MKILVLNSFKHLFETVFERRVYLFELLVQHFVLSLSAIILIVVIGIGIGISLLRYKGIRQVVLGIVN